MKTNKVRSRGRSGGSAAGRLVATLLLPVAGTVAMGGLLQGTGLTAPLQAQELRARSAGPIVLELPASTRGLGLGGTFHGGLRESDAVFSSPGHLNTATGMEAAFQQWAGGGGLMQLSAATGWWSGGAALGVRVLAYGAGGADGGPILPIEEGELRNTTGSESLSEIQVTAGYGRVLYGIRVGAAGSLIQLGARGGLDRVGAVSVGAARNLGPVVVSVAALDVGPDLRVPRARESDASERSLALAREVVLGAASQTLPVGPLDLNAATRIALQKDGSFTFGGGLEASYWPIQGRTYSLRIGAREPHDASTVRRWTLGGGFRGDRLGIDYALVPFQEGSASHRIGLSFR